MLGLVRLGLNANWLLTGEGPMLLADLAAAPVTPPAAPAMAYPQVTAPAAPAVLHEAPTAPSAQPAPAGPVFDPKLLQQVVDFFYRWQLENKDRVRIGQKAHGAVIAVLYKVAASSGKVVKEDLEQVMSIAA